MLREPCDIEKFSCEGSPMPTLRLLETVETVVPPVSEMLACTRTGVGRVPEFTRTATRPCASERASKASPTPLPSMSTPPAPVSRVRRTGSSRNALPAASRTSKVTLEDSTKPEAFRKIASGEACTKPMLDAPGRDSGSDRLAELAEPTTTA
jgi:hypothetical protein